MKALSNRTIHFTDSAIRRMTRIANHYGAINLSQGFPDFDPPTEITDALARVAKEGPHQYALTWGALNFREAVVRKQTRFMGVDWALDPDKNVVITCGSTEAMMATMMTVTNPGDKVVIFSPFYENYTADTLLAQSTPIYVPLVPPEFSFDPNVLEDAIRQEGVKALILCNPSNPCGKVFTYDELSVIAALAIKYDIYVITDEVYEHIIYAPNLHTYLATLPGMWERTICCTSLSKTYSITGWRLGYVFGPEEIIDRVKPIHDFMTVCAASPLMEAALVGLNAPQSYYDELQAKYTHMRTIFLNGLKGLGFPYTEPQGAYYVMADISEFRKKDESDTEFCERLCRDVGVGAVPGSSFFREDINHLIRFHFAKRDETLYAALEHLNDIRKKMK